MKETEEISKPIYGCEFCGRTFIKKSTVLNHICEYKHRWLDKDRAGNRIGFQCWVQFYKKNTAIKKQKTYEDFIKSAYYIAFVKFGSYCIEINALNISRFVDWLVKNQIKLDNWCSDNTYTKYLIEYLKDENALDALYRSIETTIELSKIEGIQSKDYLRYGNKNKICHAITSGKISPWLLYQSSSGIEFIDSLDNTQVKMILDYINPEKWALKFLRYIDEVNQVKEILNESGY